jgi:aryl-alcohol dehydrogenase-like predicted oxidoreductase
VRYRHLGRTGILVSEVGFGGWGIGGCAYGETDDGASLRALHRALDVGITYFDTADLYGDGRSERLIGKALTGCRARVVIGTKVGYVGRDCDRGSIQNFSAPHIRRSLETSLKRLNTDYVDIYYLHSPPITVVEQSEALGVLEDMRRQGKTRATGISLRSTPDGLKLTSRFDVVQVIYNLVDQRPRELGLLTRFSEEGVGVVARVPLGFGLLTGKYSEDDRFTGSDQRARWTAEQRAEWVIGSRKYAFLPKTGGQSMAQACIKFCLGHLGISTVIPGMKTAEQVEENSQAGDSPPLSDRDLATAYRIYERNRYAHHPRLRQESPETSGTSATG